MSNYFTYWHISAPVFIRPADTSELFLPVVTRRLSDELRQFAETHQTLAVLTGPTGSGKTTLLRWLAASVPMKSHDVFLTTLLSREQSAGWLLPRIAEYFQSGEHDEKDWKQVICSGFDQLTNEGRHLIVCIDAAHLICTDDSLADLEAFFNLQELTDPRVSFILSGGKDFAERIKKHPPLSLRVNCLLETGAFERHDLDNYLALRLKQSGISVNFDTDALTMVYRQSQGNFLITNMVLERCLIEAANKNSRRITAFIVEHALQSMMQKPDTESKSTLANLTSSRDNHPGPAAGQSVAKPPGQTEQIEKKIRADQHGVGKNDHETPSSIKLSSLFKQDEE